MFIHYPNYTHRIPYVSPRLLPCPQVAQNSLKKIAQKISKSFPKDANTFEKVAIFQKVTQLLQSHFKSDSPCMHSESIQMLL